ncbi:MAG: hypothetical protein ACRDTT_10895 [Pseudonocardiaceae bacterium]
MLTTRVAGEDLELDETSVERAVAGVDPYDVVRWLRTNGLRATVWKVPATPEEAGSTLSTP